MTWLGSLPAWAIFSLFAGGVLLLTLALDSALHRSLSDDVRARAGPTAATTLQALATIYAVLVAFVIVDEYSQLRDAQSQVSAQAAQLEVVFENSRNLPPLDGRPIRLATLAYAHSVVDLGIPSVERNGHLSHATDRAFTHIFDVVNAIEPKAESGKVAYQQILTALGQSAQERSNLVNGAHATIPLALFIILALLAAGVLAVASLMDTRHRGSHRFILAVLAVGLSMTLALVAALDNPFRGFISIDSTPISNFAINRSQL